MHQHPRPAPRSAASANNPNTNPERTNNPRDQPLSRNRSSVDLAAYTERAGGEAAVVAARGDAAAGSAQDRENQKLNQIILDKMREIDKMSVSEPSSIFK